jgi:CubicO group peptidase (beta-lactamase class C family)
MVGAVALVARRGRVAYLEAFGQRDREAGDPMPEDAIFRIASQTKALISVAVLMLQEEGKLLISDPAGKYLPAFMETTVAVPREGGGYDVVDAERPITIRDLLMHRSGVSYGGGPASDRWQEAGIQGWYFADRDEPVRATVDRMAALPFDARSRNCLTRSRSEAAFSNSRLAAAARICPCSSATCASSSAWVLNSSPALAGTVT